MTGSAPAPRTWRDPGGAAARCSSPALPRSLRSPAAAAAADVDGSWTDASADAAGRARRQWLPRGPGHAPMRLESGGGSCSDAMPARFIRQSGAIPISGSTYVTSGWQFVARSVESASARRTVPTAQESRDQIRRVSGGELSAIEDSRPRTNRAAINGPSTRVLLAPTLVLAVYGGTHVSPNQSDSAADRLPHSSPPWCFVVIGTLTRRWHLAAFAVAVGLVHRGRQAGVLVPADRGLWLVVNVAIRSPESRIGRYATAPTRPLNVVVTIWFAIAAATAVWVTLPGFTANPGQHERAARPKHLSDLARRLPEGRYPRRSTSAFDNRPFLR